MNIKETIERLIERQDLSFEEAGQVMGAIMEGSTTQSQIGAFGNPKNTGRYLRYGR